MKSVLISIQPYWVFLIIAKTMGWNIPQEKTVEARKSYPKAENWNKVAKIYCSKDKRSFSEIPKEYQHLMEQFLGKVVGEFVCDQLCWVLSHPSIFAGHPVFFQKAIDDACLTRDEVDRYSTGKDVVGWHITQLNIYDKPKPLSDFYKECAGLDNTGLCYECENAVGEECDCAVNGRLHFTRPPQSWCYVEDM